jgi:hypothetical protein
MKQQPPEGITSLEEREKQKEAWRERKRRSRANKKIAAASPTSEKSRTDFHTYCVRFNVIRFEELAPGCPAVKLKLFDKACPLKTCPHLVSNVEESLSIARLFARAARADKTLSSRYHASIAEPREGETVRQFCTRIYYALTTQEGKEEFVEPLLNQSTWKLDTRYEVVGPTLWSSTWKDEDAVLIDVANLPPLPGEQPQVPAPPLN